MYGQVGESGVKSRRVGDADSVWGGGEMVSRNLLKRNVRER